MKVQIMQADGGGTVTGYLQDDDVGFGLTNSYSAPFEAAAGGLFGVAAQVASSGGSAKFKYMFNQFWDSATPPEITLNLAFIAGLEGMVVKDNINAVLDIFGSDMSGGMLVPPGGLTGLGGLDTAAITGLFATMAAGGVGWALGGKLVGAAVGAAVGVGTGVLETLEKVSSYRRLVTVYIGDGDSPQITFENMLAERVEFKGRLPLVVNGDFPVAFVTCVFKKTTLLLRGERFMK